MAKPKSRRRRTFDQMDAELGREVLANIRALHELRELGKVMEGRVERRTLTLAEIAKSVGAAGLDRGEMERAVVKKILEHPVSGILGRLKRGDTAEGNATAQAVRDLAGKAKPKPRLAVTSPKTIARIIETIGKRHPEIAVELNKLGLTVEDGALLMYKILDYSKARSRAGVQSRINTRGGIFFEMLLAYHPEVVAKERAATAVNAKDWLRGEPSRFGLNAEQAEQAANALDARIAAASDPRYGKSLLASGDVPGLGDVDALANNLWLIRLTDVRDEAGRLMSDHFRALISISPDGKSIDIVPIGVGESKFRSKAAEVIPQLIQNLGRARDTLRASNLPNLANLPVNVRWGKQLVVIGQSEKALHPKRYQGIEAKVRAATKAGNDMKVNPASGATAQEAAAARRLIELFLQLAEQSRAAPE